MKKRKFKQSIAAVMAMTLLAASCNKEDHDGIVTPALRISQSESLSIPSAIELPADQGGHERVVTYYAEGVQKYVAREIPGTSPVRYEWSFVAPQANLYDKSGAHVGTHTAGPSWQLSPSDSIFAQAFTPARTAPSPEAGNIPWLLLKTKEGKTATGIFSSVDYIQRIGTTGGVAPATAPSYGGQTADVPYTAIYRFTRKKL